MKKETISLSPKEKLNVVENERIKESPFSVCGNKEQGFVLTIGTNLISNRIFQTKDAAIEYCRPENMTWNDLLVATSVITIHIFKNQKHEEK